MAVQEENVNNVNALAIPELEMFGKLTGVGGLQYAYTAPVPEDPKERMAYTAEVMNFLTKADHKIGDCLGEVIPLRHVFCHKVLLAQEDGGTQEALRTVLVAADGTTYEAVSAGVLKGLAVLFQLFGPPATWKEPVPIRVVQVSTKRGYRIYAIQVAKS